MTLVTDLLLFSIIWGVLVVGLARSFAVNKRSLAGGCGLGLIIGAPAGFFLLRSFAGEGPFVFIKFVLSLVYIALFVTAAVTWYRPPGSWAPRRCGNSGVAWITATLAAMAYAVLVVCRIPFGAEHAMPIAAAFILALAELWLLIYLVEPLLPPVVAMPRGGLHLLVVSLLLLLAAFSPRLDLFGPLSMKVMKLIHDFVHQFFESLLIPDHPFFRTDIWNYIGLLFSNSVGFWGGLVIWFIPAAWLALAIFRQEIPSVAHLRQPATRRKLTAAYLRERRWRLFFPLLAAMMMAGAIYKSNNPSVEYWDPKPVAVKADGAGEITIPVKEGDIDLKDGKLHKYIFQQGSTKVRFFVLYHSGKMTVVLDACSICQPEGYGQGDDTVICYYCKTLIPLETVGKPGGCNPVPVPYSADAGGVRVSGKDLVNTWKEQVQSAEKIPGGRK
jgi:hypothetical protein